MGLSPTNRIIVLVIVLASVAGILETEPAIYGTAPGLFDILEIVFGVVFTAEYLARLWAIAEDRGAMTSTARRLRFVVNPAALVDLAVIIATFSPAIGMSASSLRLVRLIRIARLAKLGRMSRALRRVAAALALRRYELTVTLAFALTLLLVGATMLYWLEGDVQPDKFGSVPRSLWWAVTTLTTIGYGDVYPITPAGKVVAALLGLSGVGLVALPAGIMAGAMHEVVGKRDGRDDLGSMPGE
jgi:voltage-gated potassium channel